MNASDLYRWAGIAGLVAGAANLLAELLPAGPGDIFKLLANVLGLWVLAALYLRQRTESGKLGFAGYVLQSFGIALAVGFLFTQAFVLAEQDEARNAELLAGPLGLAAVVMLALLTLGAILFGIATIRAGVFPKWAAGLFTAGFVVAAAAPFIPRAVASFGELLISASLFWFGYALMAPARTAQLDTN